MNQEARNMGDSTRKMKYETRNTGFDHEIPDTRYQILNKGFGAENIKCQMPNTVFEGTENDTPTSNK